MTAKDMKTSQDATTCLIGLYLYGDDLEPEEVSARIGSKPTKAITKGQQKQLSPDKTVTQKTGFWELSSEVHTDCIDRQLRELIDHIALPGSIKDIPGVSDGHIDIYFATSPSCDLKFGIELTEETISLLAKLGLSLQISAS